LSTEQIILEAAEKLFIEKGFNGARTTEIAKLAGVNHALLHYYYQTKENLFNCVFERISVRLVALFDFAFEGNAPFFEKLKKGIELHFDCMSKQIDLPVFIIREIMQNQGQKERLLTQVTPSAKRMLAKMQSALKKEARTGKIRPVKATNLLINIASLNVFSFVVAKALFDTNDTHNAKALKKMLDARKKNNVETIINSLKCR